VYTWKSRDALTLGGPYPYIAVFLTTSTIAIGLTVGFSSLLISLTIFTIFLSLYQIYDVLMLFQGKVNKIHMIDEDSYMLCLYSFHYDVLTLFAVFA